MVDRKVLEAQANAILRSVPVKKQAKKSRKKPRRYAPTPNDPKNTKSFYASWEWKKVRMQALERDGHRCLSCGASPANLKSIRLVVDHIKPIKKYWELRLDLNNLQVLCDDCNMGKGAWLEADFRVDENADMDREWREITS